MAENVSKSSGSGAKLDDSTAFAGYIIIFFLLTALAGLFVERYFSYLDSGETIFEALYSLVAFAWPVSLIFSILFIIGIVYSVKKLTKVNTELKLKFHSSQDFSSNASETGKMVSKRWQGIIEKLESPSMGDWKLAILEADIILDEIVHRMKYPGETLGEKLKNVERSDFNTADKAIEAHKVRNTIARESGNFFITQEEARRVIDLYREVFKEFRYI